MRGMVVIFVLAVLTVTALAEDRARYPWPEAEQGLPLSGRIAPPSGYERQPASPGSFAEWLRGLPVRDGRPDVLLFDGRKKANQQAQWAVLAIDIGAKDLQQCADAVMRLRAEYLYSQGRDDQIAFRFTNGDLVPWSRWRDGERVKVQGNRVTWTRSAVPDPSYESFRRWLDLVFTYAGTASLERELTPVTEPALAEAGDVFIQGGFPGHAVLVADVTVNVTGQRALLLLQSYMPAQDIHILRNPGDPDSPWYPARSDGALETPEWKFNYKDLRRFASVRP